MLDPEVLAADDLPIIEGQISKMKRLRKICVLFTVASLILCTVGFLFSDITTALIMSPTVVIGVFGIIFAIMHQRKWQDFEKRDVY